jgi:hypothetical protein
LIDTHNITLGLIVSYGRSGSSRLMQLMRLTDAAAVAGGFPYEVRDAQFGVLCSTGAGDIDADGTLRFDDVAYDPPIRRFPGEPEAAFRQRIVSESLHLRAYLGPHGRLRSGVIVEKAIGLEVVQHILDALPAAFCVVLDRDPRDVFLSVLAFNERRNFVGFGAENGPSTLAENIVEYFRQAGELIRRNPGRARIVEYKDIVTNPVLAVRQALHTKVEADAAAIAAMEIVTNPAHVTARDVSRSLDRWRAVPAAEWAAEFTILQEGHRSLRE